MDVRAKKAYPQRKLVGGQPVQAVPAQNYTFPAPIRGWVLNENLATVQPAGARILDNWICTTTGCRVRGGRAKHATIGATPLSIWSYNGTSEKMFAATSAGVFDVTAPANPETALTAAVTGRTSGYYSAAQFGTAGGDFQYLVNGVDKPLLYDGTSFVAIDGTSTPAITGVTTTKLSHVWSFASRLFFIESGTMNAWYLPVDSIGGAVNQFSLAGIFKKGSSLLFGATWSLDAGDGLDDKCLFVSTEGEVAVYEGTNPGDANAWSKAGVYSMPRPMGKKAFTQAGGDLLIATVSGLIPVSATIKNDIAALESKSVSRAITPYWQTKAQARALLTGESWEFAKVQRNSTMFLTMPDPNDAEKPMLAVNLLTGGWSRCTGWDGRCLIEFNDCAYIGSADGCIYKLDTGGNDNGSIYTAVYLGQHESMGSASAKKTVLQMRAMFQTGSPIAPYISAQPDFQEVIASPPSSVANYTTDVWDIGLWDVAVWDATTSISNSASWTAGGITGGTIAPELQLSFGVDPTPAVELVSIDATYSVGAVVA